MRLIKRLIKLSVCSTIVSNLSRIKGAEMKSTSKIANALLLYIFSCLSFHSYTITPSIFLIDDVLNQYKAFLDNGTLNQDWSYFSSIPKSRFYTFRMAFEHFVTNKGKVVVELGTTRSFVHGGNPGCNLSDTHYWTPHKPENWDWGAGFFTRMACESLVPFNAQIHTIDICTEHIERCKVITSEFKNIIYHVCSSEDFLLHCNFPEGIDLLYLDTGDMTPIEPTALLQLREAQIIVERNLVSANGIILIDDVKNSTPQMFGEKSNLGKSKYSLPYLLEHGFEIIADEYQVILKKKKNYHNLLNKLREN